MRLLAIPGRQRRDPVLLKVQDASLVLYPIGRHGMWPISRMSTRDVTKWLASRANSSDADPLGGGRRHRVTQGVNCGCYFSSPKVAPQSWSLSAPVPNRLPTWNEKPVRLVTTSCGRGLSVGTEMFG